MALALKRVDLIERLTEKSIIRDLFEALSAGRLNVASDLARAARCDLERFHVCVQVEPAPDGGGGGVWLKVAEHAEQQLRRIAPSSFCRATSESLRALLSLPPHRPDRVLCARHAHGGGRPPPCVDDR